MQPMKKIDSVVEAIYKSVKNGEKIAVYGDYDVDGLMALMAWKETASYIKDMAGFFIYHYYARTHRIDRNFLNFCLSRKADMAIICDTGSADMELLERFCAYGIKCVILDHHETSYNYEDFPEGCYVLNTEIDRRCYDINNEMCGGSMAFVVCSLLLEKLQVDYDIGSLATYALIAQYADSVPMDTEFGKMIYETASIRKRVPLCIDYFIESYSAVTKRFAEYTFAPKVNAAFRREEFRLINGLFLEQNPDAFLLVNQLKELHLSTIEVVNTIIKLIQWEDLGGIIVANLSPLLNSSIPNNFIINHKGRIAGALANQENKPCVCVCDSGGMITGSFRDLEGRNFLEYFASLFQAGGHPAAFGFSLSYTDWPYFANTVKSVGKMMLAEKNTKTPNPIYDMSKWFDLDMLNKIAYDNEFSSPRNPPTYVHVNLKRVIESTKYGFSYLLHSNGVDSIWFSSERRIHHPQRILLYPYLQKKIKTVAIWK